jgi:hypothetical protein
MWLPKENMCGIQVKDAPGTEEAHSLKDTKTG